MKSILKILIFPVYFLIMLPIEYNLWKCYRYAGLKESLVKFIYNRM